MKKWTVLSPDPEGVKHIIQLTDLSSLTAEVLSSRGYNDIESVVSFFNTDELADPFLLADMSSAVHTITEAINNGETICIYGDYDCDGVTSTAILYDYLVNMGAEVMCYIPERSEGYGLNIQAIDSIHQNGASLIITVDNGISAIAEAEYIKKLGMKLVITDHHQPSSQLPAATAVVDPHRKDCPSAFKQLAGVGVTLKLLAALDEGYYDAVVEQYGDIAAIGTIADVVSLKSENRVIVSKGLELIRNTENLGLISLMDDCGVDPQSITSTKVAFTIAPRINAAGRFGSPITALDMLTCDDGTATAYAHQLSQLNDKRKACEGDIYKEVDQYISSHPDVLKQRVIVISGLGWHHGVIGIVAARLMETYEKPVVVISSDSDGLARGSARSIPGFNIFKCFEYCRELLVKYGGHECAGGLTVETKNLEQLNAMIQDYASLYCPQMPKFTLTADKLVRGKDLTIKNVADLKRLEPFGTDNAEPLFAFSGAKVMAVIPLKNGEHTKLDIEYDGVRLNALLFRKKTVLIEFGVGDVVDLMGNLAINSFRGQDSVSLTVTDYRLHGIRQDKYFAGYDAYQAFMRGEEVKKEYLIKGLPSREELVYIYKFITTAKTANTAESLYARLSPKGINSFKLHIALDAFAESGLIETDGAPRRINCLKPAGKVDIMSTPTLHRLQKSISNL